MCIRDRLWAASTEIYIPLSKEHESLAALEQAMKENNTEVISPSMCYAYAAKMCIRDRYRATSGMRPGGGNGAYGCFSF